MCLSTASVLLIRLFATCLQTVAGVQVLLIAMDVGREFVQGKNLLHEECCDILGVLAGNSRRLDLLSWLLLQCVFSLLLQLLQHVRWIGLMWCGWCTTNTPAFQELVKLTRSELRTAIRSKSHWDSELHKCSSTCIDGVARCTCPLWEMKDYRPP